MPTDLHQSVVHQLVERGYKTHGAREFIRLAYYLHDELDLDDASALLAEFFNSGVGINRENATRVAMDARGSLEDGDEYPSYPEARQDAPNPKGIPDAWAYRASTECEGRGVIEFIEVFDTSRTTLEKIANYGAEMDLLESVHFILYEMGANDGAVVRHDPLKAFMLHMYHDIETGRVGAPVTQEVKQAYADHLRKGDITINADLQAS